MIDAGQWMRRVRLIRTGRGNYGDGWAHLVVVAIDEYAEEVCPARRIVNGNGLTPGEGNHRRRAGRRCAHPGDDAGTLLELERAVTRKRRDDRGDRADERARNGADAKADGQSAHEPTPKRTIKNKPKCFIAAAELLLLALPVVGAAPALGARFNGPCPELLLLLISRFR